MKSETSFSFIELQQVESTNNYATALVHEGLAQHGMVVWTHDQTKGKGQRNKSWSAEAGSNITMSLIIAPQQLSTSQAFLLSMTVCSAAREFFSQYAGEHTKVKWPNDLYWRDRKAGGILIENIVQGSLWKFAIIGLGININQIHFGLLETAVSLKQITGLHYQIPELIGRLCEEIDRMLQEMYANPEQISHRYHEHLYKKGEIVKLKKDNRVFNARIKCVSLQGQLVVEHATEERFDVGSIEWIP